MSEQQAAERPQVKDPGIPKDPTFVDFFCFQLDPAFRRLPQAERDAAKAEFVEVLEAHREDLQARFYLTTGLRNDVDFVIWSIAKDVAPFQVFAAALLGTTLGTYLTQPYTYLAMTRPSQYNPGHIPAFEVGSTELKYLFLYPFIKTREWYVLPFSERRKIMQGHMDVGEMYPMVRLNTTYSFGLGDQDFVLAFETDEPAAFEDLVQKLRETESSLYTVKDTPFILSQWCPTGNDLMEGLGL